MNYLLVRAFALFLAGVLHCYLVHASGDIPVIYIQPDGTIKDDGTNCVWLDSEAQATVYLEPPPSVESGDESGDICSIHGRCGDQDTESAFDYAHHGLYLDLASINSAGRTEFDSDYLIEPKTLKRIIRSPGNAGKQVCLTVQHRPGRSPFQRVGSWFETVGFYGMSLATLWGVDKISQNQLINYKNGDFFSILNTYNMLIVHLKGNEDFEDYLIRQGFSPAQASCLLSATHWAGMPLMNELSTPATDMTIAGRYAHFWFSESAKSSIHCLREFAFQPLGEWVSPANGSIRQPGSLTVTDAWKGPGALMLSYATQSMYPQMYPGDYQDTPPLLWAKVTVTSSIGTRTFIKNINERYFWRDSEILPYLYDGLVMLSIATLDDPSHVTSVYLKENIKEMTIKASDVSMASHDKMQEMEEWIQGEINNGIYYIALTGLLNGVMTGFPFVKGKVGAVGTKLLSYQPAIVQQATYAIAAQAQNVKAALSTATGYFGGALLAMPGARRFAGYLPVSPTSVRPAIGFSISIGFAKYCALRYTRTVSTQLVSRLSDIVADVSEPGTLTRDFFQSDKRLVIDHYLAEEGNRSVTGILSPSAQRVQATPIDKEL